MPKKAHAPFFRENELQLFPLDVNPDIADDLLRTISYNMYFDRINQIWRMASADAYGRILVNAGVADTGTPTPRNVTLVGNTNTQIVFANPRRQILMIEFINLGDTAMAFTSAQLTATPVFLPPASLVVFNSYFGDVWAVSYNINGQAIVIEI